MRIALTALLLSVSVASIAQDTCQFMLYNLLQFPNEKPNRISYLKEIVKDVEPDVFMVCELSNNAGSVTILTQALNTDGVSHYQRASFWDDGTLNNMLYYNTKKYKLNFQDTVACEPRFATVYQLLYRPALLEGDSIRSNFIVVHLKAGSSDVAARTQAAKKIRRYIDQELKGENVFLAGDFNIYSPTEGAFQTFTQKGDHPLIDPIDQIGEWSNDDYYARVHTQSTRTTSFGGGSTGGMDDRFDWILMSKDVESGDNKLEYVFGSYKAFGNDGQHFNTAINIGTNKVVSEDIADALHEMSDHLPVVMQVSYSFTSGLQDPELPSPYQVFLSHTIRVRSQKGNDLRSISLCDASGKVVFQKSANGVSNLEISRPSRQGIYLLRIETNEGFVSRKLMVPAQP